MTPKLPKLTTKTSGSKRDVVAVVSADDDVVAVVSWALCVIRNIDIPHEMTSNKQTHVDTTSTAP